MQFGLPNTTMDSLSKEGKYPIFQIVDRLGWEVSPYDQMAPLSALGSEIGWICDVSPSHSVWSSQSHSGVTIIHGGNGHGGSFYEIT